MTNLANQLRAAAFLASRDAYVKGAFALPALWVAWVLLTALLAPAGTVMSMSFESGFLGFVSWGSCFGTCLAVTGLVVHDLSSGGLRAAMVSAGGRQAYVASRAILALALAVLLSAWSALLGLLFLLVPHVCEGASAAELALRVLARTLVSWTYAVFGLLLLWLARRSRGFGGTVLVAALLGAGLLNYVLMLPLIALIPLSSVVPALQGVAYGMFQLLAPLIPSALLGSVTGAAGLDLLPVVTCAVCVIACLAASRALMARASL